jgi:hypothetical protein
MDLHMNLDYEVNPEGEVQARIIEVVEKVAEPVGKDSV